MKLFKRPPRTNAPMQPQNVFAVPTPKYRPKPSELLQDLRSSMPEPPVQDYANFLDTKLYNAMLEEAKKGKSCLDIDCNNKSNEILLDEFKEWESWLLKQGTKNSLVKGLDDDLAILISWRED